MKNFTIATLALVAASLLPPSLGIAGCDKEVVDANLQIAAPLTETEIRTLIAQAELESGEASGDTQTAER